MTEQFLHDYNKWLTEVWSKQQINIPFMIDAPSAFLSYRKSIDCDCAHNNSLHHKRKHNTICKRCERKIIYKYYIQQAE